MYMEKSISVTNEKKVTQLSPIHSSGVLIFFNISPEHFYAHKTSTLKKNLLKKIICFFKSRCFMDIKMFFC